MIKFKNIVLAIILLSMNVSIVNATEYYIAPYGDDSNTGLSLDQAWKTLTWAVNSSGKVHSDTTIYVVDGIYYDSAPMIINDNNDGNITHPLIIKAYNGTPIFDGGGAETNNNFAFLIQGSSAYSTGYVTISNLTFRNYKQIFDIRNAENITLSNNTFYNVRVSQSYGIGLIAYATRNITIDNNIFHDAVGYNSLAIGGRVNDLNRVHHIYITNNQIYNNDKHAGIQWGNADDVFISGNKLWNNTYSGGITAYKGKPYEHITNSIVQDCTLNDIATPLYISSSESGLWKDIIINNSGTITLYGNVHADNYRLSNLTMRNISVTNPTGLLMYLTGNGLAQNILFERFNVTNYKTGFGYDWRIQDTNGNITIRDEVDDEYTILLKSTLSDRNASMKIEYTDGKIFEVTSIAGDANLVIPATWYPTVSNYTEEIWGAKDRRFKITAYSMTARPTTDPATITVNKFDTSLSQGNILISFTADTINGNNVVFTVSDLQTNHNYLVKKDGADFTTRQANFSGSIQFSNSEWSEHTFTIEETTSKEGPSITEFFPENPTPPQNNGSTYEFTVEVSEPLTSSGWYLDGELIASSTQSIQHTWISASTHDITFTGSNDYGSVSQTWVVNVNDQDLPPTASAGPDRTTNPGASITFDGSASTDDIGIKSYTWNFGDSQQDTGAVVTHTYDIAGTYTVTLTVTDTAGNTATDTADITVRDAPSNSIVSITPSSSQITPGAPFTLTIPVTPGTPITGAQFDLLFESSLATVPTVTEGDLLNQNGASTFFSSGTINNAAGTVTNVYGSILAETTVSSQGSFATIDMTAGSTTGYLNLNLSNVIISDADSSAAPYTLTNATVLIDTAPELGSIGAKSVDEKDTLAFTISASDADGDSMTYSASGLPDSANFNTASGAFSWTPVDGRAGTYVVTFEVTDGYLSDPEAVTITVNEDNHAPVMDPIGARSVDEEDALVFTVSASDVDGDILTYSATGLPGGANFNTASGAFAWTPVDGQAGTYVVTFEVTDGPLSDSEAVTITVNEMNHAPVITAFSPVDGAVYNEKDNIAIAVDATDADDQELSYTIRIDGVTKSTQSSYTWKTNYGSSGVYTIDVTVSDGTNEVTAQHTISINDVHPHWDVNEDGIVNILDITLIGQKIGTTVEEPLPRFDVNQDGEINVLDLTVTAYYFGENVV